MDRPAREQLATTRFTLDTTPVRHTATVGAAAVVFRISPPTGLSRDRIATALAAATQALRTIDDAFPRGEPAIVAAVMAKAREAHERTRGYFDPWPTEDGFDPGGLLSGWTLEQAAAPLRLAGIENFALAHRGELLVRGRAHGGGPWRVGVHPDVDVPDAKLWLSLTDAAVATSARPVRGAATTPPVAVTGPELTTADVYATALRVAGTAGLSWFPTPDGYRGYLLTDDAPTTNSIEAA